MTAGRRSCSAKLPSPEPSTSPTVGRRLPMWARIAVTETWSCSKSGSESVACAPRSRVFTEDLLDERRARRGGVADGVGARELGERGGEIAAAVGDGEDVALAHLVAELDEDVDSDGGVDAVLLALPAAAEEDDGAPDGLGVDDGDEAVPARGDRSVVGRGRRQDLRRVVAHARVAALRRDDLAEFLEGAAIGEDLLDARSARRRRRLGAAQDQHLGAERDGERARVVGALALKDLDRLDDLAGVADRPADGLA